MHLLLLSGGAHPYSETTPIMAGFFESAGHTVDVSDFAFELNVPSTDGYDAIVLNTRRGPDSNNDFSEVQRENLAKFVSNGGPLISIHISPDSSPDWPEMKKITGGGWVSGTSNHPPFGRFTVNIKNPDHPCAAGLTDFEIDDESYCDLDIQPGIDVFLTAMVEGIERPMAWTHQYGKGRVFNTSLGHAGVSMRNPLFQKHVLIGVDWATSGS
jgi:type 1 glutamine amidotransferase